AMTSTDDSEDSALEQRLAFHRHMHKHLQELSLFVLYEAVESDLTDVEWARHLKQQMAEMKDLPRRRIRIPFEQTKTPAFHAFVERLYAANPAPVLIWTEFATTCGPMRIGSITDVNFDFGFDANAAGIVSFTTVDGADRLLLSWEEDDAGQRILEIEVTGKRWCQAVSPK
ncbi:MAG TPA: hypothetical protein VM659_23125, partial [Dongiaceae bacterium]|nr:hypothetical protein [Dongiaceae bacterium]